MSNKIKKTNVYERLWKLYITIGKMIMDGVRDPEKVADLLQTIVDMKVYLKQLFVGEVITFNGVTIFIYELVKNATFEDMFGGFDPNRRRWKDEEEALSFAKKNKDKLGLNGNFFELEGGFVAGVGLGQVGQPYVYDVGPLSDDGVWGAGFRRRVFYPQQ